MNIVSLYIPSVEDCWYEQQLESDPLTMSYNAGYDISCDGYHYDSGCIDFPKEKWQAVCDRRIRENRYFAYIRDEVKNCFVGYVNYQYSIDEGRYDCGVLIEHRYRGMSYGRKALDLLCMKARKNGIRELYDSFETDRGHVLDMFLDAGFEVFERKTWKKFGSDADGVIVRKIL